MADLTHPDTGIALISSEPKLKEPIAKAEQAAPELVVKPYRFITKEERSVNFQWRMNNKLCTVCCKRGHILYIPHLVFRHGRRLIRYPW